MFCCSFCGRDTKNKSMVCRHCTGGHSQNREYFSSTMEAFDEFYDECSYDYSEDSLGPKQSDVRFGSVWIIFIKEWRKYDRDR
jgi:hypothetical protein